MLADGPEVVVDVEQFTSSADRAAGLLASGEPGAALAAAESALSLWTGEPLAEDEYAEWARPARDRLHRVHQEVLECGARGALAIGDGGRAVHLAAEAVALEPLREAAHLLLVQAQATAGDQAAALAAFDRLRATLAQELGIDPSPEAAALQTRLLRGSLVRKRTQPDQAEAPPLLGREAELSGLLSLGSASRVAVLAGRSGSGKSRLLAELRARSERPTLAARALLPERESPWSLTRSVLAAARALGVDTQTPLPTPAAATLSDLLAEPTPARGQLDALSQRALLLHSTVRLLEAAEQLTVVVDDLQWVDSSSLDLLRLLAERVGDVVLVMAYRPEEVAPGSPVEEFLNGLRTTVRPTESPFRPSPPLRSRGSLTRPSWPRRSPSTPTAPPSPCWR